MKKREKIASLIGNFAHIVKEAAKGRPPKENKKPKVKKMIRKK